MSFRAPTVIIAFAFSYSLLKAVAVAEEGYQQLAREIHNQYRANHHVSPLNSNDDLNNRAVQCAEYYALRGVIDHTCPFKNGAGENLWLQRGGNPTNDDTARSSSNSWYSEEPLHNYNGEFSAATGHFTQMVWKNSLDLGFGVGRRNGVLRFMPSVTVGCALYSPPGNVYGQFQDNVISP